jgi:uncharacterized protein YceK
MMRTLVILLLLLGGCTTVDTNDPSWEYPKEVLQ